MNTYDYANATLPNNGDMVYDPKFGYITPKKLEKKRLRRNMTALSFLPIVMYTLMLAFTMISVRLIAINGYCNYQAYPETSGIPPLIYYALQCFSSPFAIFLPFFIYAAASKNITMSEAVRVNKVKFVDKLLIIFAGLSICLLANFPTSWLGSYLSRFGYDSSSSSVTPTQPILMALYFIEVAIMPPVFEEFAFRGVILGSLRKYGDCFAIITSAFIFGCMHMSATSIPFAFISGLVMGFVYVVTGNIWVNIGIHFMNNGISVALDLVEKNCPEQVAAVLDFILFYGMIILGIICLIVLLVKKKVPFRLYKPEKKISWISKLECTVFNPGFICFLIMVGAVTTLDFLGVY